MPKVSVVIPTYNRDDYICETIDSVLNQTYSDYEIIVVDDGSTDKTLEKIAEYGAKIKIVEQPNSERAIARNNGIQNSTGEYIAFLDSDDLWVENKLEKQIEILDANSEAVLTYSASWRIDENSKRIKSARRQLKGESGSVFESLLFRNLIVSATPLCRAEIVKRIEGFKTKHIPYEDWEFWIRLSLEGDFIFNPTPLALYRVHSSQSVQNVKAERIEEVTTALLKDSLELKDLSETLKNKVRAHALIKFAYWYFVSGKHDIAVERVRGAVELNPDLRSDLKWNALNYICNNPAINNLLKIERLHGFL